ncbi:MAG: quinolinate synthase NadA [Candidatus Eisenbacteria sp.]|nr:quinolinate synthase NadA [Candidatus Eisenbacteria bacterium]
MSTRTYQETYEFLKERLGHLYSDEELRVKAQLAVEVNRLKNERGAVVLGHNYMDPALFLTVPDYQGDSFELCRRAAETDRDPIVFCGVKFMAETAKIINPERTVLLPSLEAGCSLAESITAADVRELRKRYPGVPVVTYINTYADVKAECDICCTSGNAARVVESLNADTVIFLPDEYLARNVARETGRHIIVAAKGIPPRKNDTDVERVMIGWSGRCEVHERFMPEDIENVRRRYPDVVVLAHPECSPEITQIANFSGSTKAMIEYVRQTQAPHYLLLTECSMGENIAAQQPDKHLLRIYELSCPHMREITLEQTLAALRENRHIIDVTKEIRDRARQAVERMLAVG